MLPVQTNQQEPITMSSLELLEVINSYRENEGKPPMRHDNFMQKIQDELEDDALRFQGVYQGGNGEDRPCYHLPKDECYLMAMRESKYVRRATINKINEMVEAVQPKLPASPLEQLAATMQGMALIAQSQIEAGQRQLALEHKVESLESSVGAQLEDLEHRLEHRLPYYHRRPSNTATIGQIRKGMNKRYGLSDTIVDQVLLEVKRVKPSGQVEYTHGDSKNVLQVWNKTDVSEAFRQFVGECERVTRCRYEHPDIPRRFQLNLM